MLKFPQIERPEKGKISFFGAKIQNPILIAVFLFS